MSALSFHLDKRQKQFSITFLTDILSSNVKELSDNIGKKWEEIKNDDWNILFIDISASKLVDSMGLNLVISLLKQAQNRGSKVKCKIASRTIHRTLLFTRLDKQMEIEFQESEPSAEAS